MDQHQNKPCTNTGSRYVWDSFYQTWTIESNGENRGFSAVYHPPEELEGQFEEDFFQVFDYERYEADEGALADSSHEGFQQSHSRATSEERPVSPRDDGVAATTAPSVEKKSKQTPSLPFRLEAMAANQGLEWEKSPSQESGQGDAFSKTMNETRGATTTNPSVCNDSPESRKRVQIFEAPGQRPAKTTRIVQSRPCNTELTKSTYGTATGSIPINDDEEDTEREMSTGTGPPSSLVPAASSPRTLAMSSCDDAGPPSSPIVPSVTTSLRVQDTTVLYAALPEDEQPDIDEPVTINPADVERYGWTVARSLADTLREQRILRGRAAIITSMMEGHQEWLEAGGLEERRAANPHGDSDQRILERLADDAWAQRVELMVQGPCLPMTFTPQHEGDGGRAGGEEPRGAGHAVSSTMPTATGQAEQQSEPVLSSLASSDDTPRESVLHPLDEPSAGYADPHGRRWKDISGSR